MTENEKLIREANTWKLAAIIAVSVMVIGVLIVCVLPYIKTH